MLNTKMLSGVAKDFEITDSQLLRAVGVSDSSVTRTMAKLNEGVVVPGLVAEFVNTRLALLKLYDYRNTVRKVVRAPAIARSKVIADITAEAIRYAAKA